MKPLSPKAQATRERILSAANELFYAQGYNATGLDRIIAHAGVAKGNFYHHFRSKEELASAVLDWHQALTFQEINMEAILADRSAVHAIHELLLRVTARMVCSSDTHPVLGCFFGNFTLELSTGSEMVRNKIRHVFQGLREMLAELIRRGQQAGEIDTGIDAEAMASIVLSLMEGASMMDKANQDQTETRKAIAFIDDYLRR